MIVGNNAEHIHRIAMSRRVPQSNSPLKTIKPPASPSKVRAGTPNTPTRTTVRATTPRKEEPAPPKPAISIRERIALKRAEVKNVAAPQIVSSVFDGPGASLEDAVPASPNKGVEDDVLELGRWSVKETIERGRSTGDFLTFRLSSAVLTSQGLFDGKALLTCPHAPCRVFRQHCLKFTLG